jgi:hypothetical protein
VSKIVIGNTRPLATADQTTVYRQRFGREFGEFEPGDRLSAIVQDIEPGKDPDRNVVDGEALHG